MLIVLEATVNLRTIIMGALDWEITKFFTDFTNWKSMSVLVKFGTKSVFRFCV